MSDAKSSTARTALAVRGVSKRFGATRALRDVQLELRAGEVHALIGGNGCGKSTLIKCLAGVYQADAGALMINGREVDLTSQTPEQARDAGLRFVHQDLGIFPMMSLTENLSLGRGFEVGAGRRIRWREAHRRAAEVLARFGIEADPRAPAASLSVPQHAMLAIARALQDEDGESGGVLVLDEPTASLPATEVKIVLDAIRALAREGHAILMVTHRLDEVRKVADRVTGFRDGAYVGTVDGDGLTEQDLVELILGRKLEQAHSVTAPREVREAVLEVRGARGGPILDASFEVYEGEVLGIAGLLGSGRTELLQMIYGLLPMQRGEVVYDGETTSSPSPGRMCRHGMAFVPEDRHAEAVFPLSSVRENLLAGHEQRYFRAGWLRDRDELRETTADVATFNIRTASTSAMIESLSGGNQQKVVLGRWLRQRPRLLLLDEPTQGVDVGARDEIYKLVATAADQGGCGVIVVSSEFEELARMCGRVLVLSHGRIVREHLQPMTAQELLGSSIGTMEAVA